MAIKKSELYSSLWASCNELRGGMDASQYKDYVLTMLFVKYISDKYKNQPFGAIKVPDGATFDDMVNMIGKPDIGDRINKEVLNPIKEANKLNEFPDFNDENKLGKGKDLVDTVSNLVRIFNDDALDFAGNSAEGDDILGDAYEFLMRHFATESGKSKGQFYTPAEVSRVLAKVIGISPNNATNQTTAYDPTCGSGSLLLKVANESGKNISLYGQEKENTTANLARMNMILHNSPTADIRADNTLSSPQFLEKDGMLKRFDYVVANPPFSLKSWSNGVNIANDPFERFNLGVPPQKNGDYAFLLHIIASMKSTAKAAVVLPHGVLFRGNAEGNIRKNILQKGYIKGIIGLPANLFYGTGIPACILILDKENAAQRKGIFMIDASKDFVKDGNKNRLREQDIRKITDVFTQLLEIEKYSRMVSMAEISDPKNDYNLNIPRYIDNQAEEDIQNIEAHLKGGIPQEDIDALSKFWKIFPQMKQDVFEEIRDGFYALKMDNKDLKQNILNHQEFQNFKQETTQIFENWWQEQAKIWYAMDQESHPKEIIEQNSQTLLQAFAKHKLLDKYDIYQHLMNYWHEEIQDDVYSVAMDGWEAGREWNRTIIKGKGGKNSKDKEVAGIAGIEGRMLSTDLLIDAFFSDAKQQIQEQENKMENALARRNELEEEHSGEDGVFGDLEKINVTEVRKLLRELKAAPQTTDLAMAAEPDMAYGEEVDEIAIAEEYLDLEDERKKAAAKIKKIEAALEKDLEMKYPALRMDEIQELVIEKKWKKALSQQLTQEIESVGQQITQRIKELAERYETTLTQLDAEVNTAEEKVKAHLEKMGWIW